jgi:hypothetical protein
VKVASQKAAPAARRVESVRARASKSEVRRPPTPANHLRASADNLADPATAVEHARRDPRRPLPHRNALERVFGIDLGGVEVHTGPAARAACEAVGARAFAVRSVVAFDGDAPPLARVAHEIAHVLQQRALHQPTPGPFAPGSLRVSHPRSAPENDAGDLGASLLPLRPWLAYAPVALYRDTVEDTQPEGLSATAKRILAFMQSEKYRMPAKEWKDKTVEKGESDPEAAPFGIGKPGAWTVKFRYSSAKPWVMKEFRDVSGSTDATASKDLQLAFGAQSKIAKEGFVVFGRRTRITHVGSDPEVRSPFYAFIGETFDGKLEYHDRVQRVVAKAEDTKTPKQKLETYKNNLQKLNDAKPIGAAQKLLADIEDALA